MSEIEAIRKRLETPILCAWPDHGPATHLWHDSREGVDTYACAACAAEYAEAHPGDVIDVLPPHYTQEGEDIAWLLGEVGRLAADLTAAKNEERAAVVAWLRGEAHFTDVGPLDTFADAYATAIEAGRHREKA